MATAYHVREGLTQAEVMLYAGRVHLGSYRAGSVLDIGGPQLTIPHLQ